ncbi:hypothetical protein B0H14DRAFT_3454948 [Mycena olivaceomarginata]|nr:hypothetical protein B0H14DRAFT_3454948 [Mycena olivaceomarginata]
MDDNLVDNASLAITSLSLEPPRPSLPSNRPRCCSPHVPPFLTLRLRVYTTIELVVMPAACRRNDLSLQSTSPLPTTPDVAARRTSVSPVRFPHRAHAGMQPAAPEIVSGERLLHAGSQHPRPLRILQCTAHSQPRPTTPRTGPLHPIAPSTSDESTALCLPARVPWDASDSGGFGSVVNAN